MARREFRDYKAANPASSGARQLLHFHNLRLIDPEAGTDTSGTLTVANGRIVGRDVQPAEGAQHVDCGGYCLAPGIVDLGVQVGEPGARHKESFRSAGQAAAAGGVTTFITRPDTSPAIDTPEALEFLRRRATTEAVVNIHHMAALTRGREGREMAEIGFLMDAGAVAFSDVDRVIADTKVFSRCLTYARSLGALVIGHPQDPGLSKGAAVTSGKFATWWCNMLLCQEGDTHARLRRMANPAFSPRLIADLQPKFQALANRLIDGFAARGECDFIAEFTEPYATGVICDLLGLPFEKWRELADIAADMGLALGVTFRQDLPRIEAAIARLFDYAAELVADRSANPGEDFISLLVKAHRENPDQLSEQEMLDMIVLAIFGGIDTTRNQLGLAMEQFILHPAQWALLAERPELGKPAVEEVMRTRPTVTWVTRAATESFEFQGLTIPEGTTLHLYGQAAVTDPAAMEDAESFDITATRKPHFGFGGGTHHCLGHFIARGDMTEALRLLARRLRNPRFNGEVEWLPDSGNTGAVRMPIAFDPA